MLGRETEQVKSAREVGCRWAMVAVRRLSLVVALAIATAAAAQVPGAPVGLEATGSFEAVDLRWRNPNDASIVRYEVRYALQGGEFGAWLRTGTGASLTIGGLVNFVPYTFQLRAVSAAGAGPAAEATATPSQEIDLQPSFGDHAIEPICYRVGVPVRQRLPHAFAAHSYSVSPALPPGLSFNTISAVISGTPTTVQPAVTYTYTGSDDDGDEDSLQFTIKVEANSEPTFGGVTVPSQRYRVDWPIAGVTLPAATGGDGPIAYRLRPALPDGIDFDANTRTISGTPTATSPAATYAYTATDEDGDAATLTFAVEVMPDSMPSFGAAAIEAQRFRAGSPVESQLPAANGGDGTLVYSVSPALPGGLAFDADRRVLNGTPTAPANRAQYVYTVTDEDGDTATLGFELEVMPDRMPSFGAAAIEAQRFRAGSPVESQLPAASGGDGTLVYSVSPALPGGMAFDADRRVLNGTPTAPASRARYVYTVTDEDGDTATLGFELEVMPDSMPTFGAAMVPAQSYRVSTAIVDLILPPAQGGDGPLTYAIAPALPSGLAFDARTRTVSGVPTAQMGGVEYAYTATDEDGDSATLAFTVEVGMAVRVAVADAAELEGQDISFVVTLSDPVPVPVTVVYATGDGTALAGEDYTSVAGTLTIPAGNTEMAVVVPVVADPRPERDEQFTLALSELINAEFASAQATGTIVDDDTERVRGEAVAHSLAAFGRAFAADAVDAISGRFQEGGPVATPIDAPAATPLTFAGNAFAADGQGLAAGAALSLFAAGDQRHPGANVESFGAGLPSGAGFALPFGAGADDRGQWTLWGRGSANRISSQPDGMRVEGDISTGYLGIDARLPRNTLVGLAVARSAADFDYRQAGVSEGEVSLDMTTLLPYVHWTLCNGLDLWALAGSGQGEATLMDDIGRADTDIDLRMAAFGLRSELAERQNLVWSLKADAFMAALTADAVAEALAVADADVQRLRLLLEGRREWQRSEQSLLAATIEFGARLDNGDADNGLGAEIGAALDYRNLPAGLGLEARGRYLLAHAETALDDWGLSVALEFDPGVQGAGASLRLAPAWGTPSSGVASLWRAERMFGNGLGTRRLDAKGSVEMEVGYGFHAKRVGAVKLYGAIGGNSAAPSYRLGGRRALAKGLGWSLEVDRLQRFGSDVDYGILMTVGNTAAFGAGHPSGLAPSR